MSTTDIEKIEAKASFICIIAGIESEINTCLVRSGIAARAEIADFPHRPDCILSSVADIVS